MKNQNFLLLQKHRIPIVELIIVELISNIPAVVEIWNTKCIRCMLIAIQYNES